jgi:hypothetical protein
MIQVHELRDRFVVSSDPVADLKVCWILRILFEKMGEKCIVAAKLVVVQPGEVL